MCEGGENKEKCVMRENKESLYRCKLEKVEKAEEDEDKEEGEEGKNLHGYDDE